MVDFKKKTLKLKAERGKIPAVVLKTNNTNGVFTEDRKSKKGKNGKYKEKVNYEGCSLVNTVTGEVISGDISPKFQGWTFDDFRELFHEDRSVRFLETMGAQEPGDYVQQREEIAELKRDGHRALFYVGDGVNRLFSRRVSKKSGWYNENTDCVPHLRDLDLSDFNGTVLDGELDYGKDSRSVQSVTGALPENAIQYQYENGFIPLIVFDILYYKGVNVQNMPLWKRKIFAAIVCRHINEQDSFPFVQFSEIYAHPSIGAELSQAWSNYIETRDIGEEILHYMERRVITDNDYIKLFKRLVVEGKEGIIVKNSNGIYEQKRSKSMLKLKAESTWDVIFMGLSEPEKNYDGKLLEEGRIHEWNYWYHEERGIKKETTHESLEIAENWMSRGWVPVTKPFFKGWCGGIICGVYRNIDDPDYDLVPEGKYMEVGEAWKEGLLISLKDSVYDLYEVTTVKGLTEELMEDLKNNHETYSAEKRVLSITANGMQDVTIGSLRHPRFFEWRDDKSAEMCTFEEHVLVKEK